MQTKGHPIRVLILAEQANPEWVSVPLVGWHHAAALAPLVDAHLVTHAINRPAIERSFWPKDKVTYISLGMFDALMSWIIKHIFKGQFGTVALTATRIPFYWLFERLAWRELRDRIKRGDFDVVHRLTPVSPVMSSPIVRHCYRYGVPFVLGPVNGGLPWPRGYANALRKEREFLSRFRSLYMLLPFAGSTYNKASAVVAASRNTMDQIKDTLPRGKEQVLYYLPENGIPAARVKTSQRQTPPIPLKAVFVGRLVPYKCADVVLKAAAPLIRAGKLTLVIIGDGPERGFLEAIIRDEKIGHGVSLAGWLPHGETMKCLESMDLLTFPSIREFGGGVVVEGMAVGVVPIVMNYGGPGEIVTDDTGFRLPLSSADQTVLDLRAVLERLVAEPSNVAKLSFAAQARIADHFTWESKARGSLAIYESLLKARSTKASALSPA